MNHRVLMWSSVYASRFRGSGKLFKGDMLVWLGNSSLQLTKPCGVSVSRTLGTLRSSLGMDLAQHQALGTTGTTSRNESRLSDF